MAALYDIKALQRTLSELQQELPDSALQVDLQRLQNQLGELQQQPRPQPVNLIVQPAPAPIQLEGHELVVVETYTRLLRALSPIVPLDQLFATAASLTGTAMVDHPHRRREHS